MAVGLAIGFGVGWLAKPDREPPIAEQRPQFQLGANSGKPVATFDGGSLTEEELAAFLSTSPAEQKPTVEDAVLAEIAAQRALAAGATADVVTAARIKRALAEAFQNERLDAIAKSSAQDEAALKAWYEAHRGDFVRPERIVVQHAFIAAAPGKEKEAADKARALEKTADADAFLAEGTKLGVVRERAFSRSELDAELGRDGAAKAFLMVKVGEVQTYEVKGGAHALRLLRREGPLDITFEQAKAQVASRRWYELRAAALDQMKKELLSGARIDFAAAERITKP